jgi:hypothetical protein
MPALRSFRRLVRLTSPRRQRLEAFVLLIGLVAIVVFSGVMLVDLKAAPTAAMGIGP